MKVLTLRCCAAVSWISGAPMICQSLRSTPQICGLQVRRLERVLFVFRSGDSLHLQGGLFEDPGVDNGKVSKCHGPNTAIF